jgi:TM2 domain-containing membrane protein YozV/ribosomal protein L40E
MSENYQTKGKDSDEHYDRRSKNADETFCQSCGAIIKTAAEICPKCGVRQVVTQAYVSPSVTVHVGNGTLPSYLVKSKSTAAILAFFSAFFLMGIGIHKFFIGKSGIGVLYLLFCWTGIPMILSVVDGVLYLMCKTDEEFTIKYVL